MRSIVPYLPDRRSATSAGLCCIKRHQSSGNHTAINTTLQAAETIGEIPPTNVLHDIQPGASGNGGTWPLLPTPQSTSCQHHGTVTRCSQCIMGCSRSRPWIRKTRL